MIATDQILAGTSISKMADVGGAEDESGYRWLNQYERTWEAIREDDSGSLQTLVDELVHRSKRQRVAARTRNVRLGMMRHLFVVIDMSRAMEESDLKPSRLACTGKHLERFVTEYFDQNPISQLGLIATKNKRAERLAELSGNPKLHISTIQSTCSKPCIGEPSLQNSLEVAIQSLRHMPGHASREVLVLLGSLTTCDPGDIIETVKTLKGMNIRCSIIGLAAEMRVCKQICNLTQGSYNVVLDERHLKDLLMEQVVPPMATEDTEASLIRMGFPQHMAKGPPSLCFCHIDTKTKGLTTKGYFCPQCRSKYCDLPVECKVCGLTLVSAPHLARSYQHLFPLQQYDEVTVPDQIPGDPPWKCHACQILLTEKNASLCPSCRYVFCLDCDIYIHETLHTCPGCSGNTAVS